MQKVKSFTLPLTLAKSAGVSCGDCKVGGVASGFLKDLDDEAITPEAVKQAIPGFMALRGPDGIVGGPLRLHHDFWQRFLKQVIAVLPLSSEQQMDLVAAIALPLGRVTKMWVDGSGVTRWEGQISQANPIGRIVWQMLKENLIHLGVSLGGKILRVEKGRDGMGRPCGLITEIRIDELSVTDNPAYRLISGETEDNGAYISALTKSLTRQVKSMNVENFLAKALGGSATAQAGSGSWGDTTTGMSRPIVPAQSKQPHGGSSIKIAGEMGQVLSDNKQSKLSKPTSSNSGPKTDIWGMTVAELTRSLEKCADMEELKKCGCSMEKSEETAKRMYESALGLAGSTNEPPGVLVNLVKMLSELASYVSELPHMDDWTRSGTIEAIHDRLHKSLTEFQEKMPESLMGSPVRPPGHARNDTQDLVFPSHYVPT
jgi:hypothetical protein